MFEGNFNYPGMSNMWDRNSLYQRNNTMPPQQVLLVNGENGVNMLQMPPRSTTIAIDQSRSDILLAWYIQTDDAGYKTKTPYLMTPYVPENKENNFEQRLSRLEAMFNEQSTYADVAKKQHNKSTNNSNEQSNKSV